MTYNFGNFFDWSIRGENL